MTPNAFRPLRQLSSLDLAIPIQQLSRRDDFCLVVARPTRLASSSIPDDFAKLVRRQLLELLDSSDLGYGHVIVILVVAALAGSRCRVG
jgi:hypothetical protein